jgi:hypothetical protein
LGAALCVGCAHDSVLPDTQVDSLCGNGILEPGEQCDVPSPGCSSCVVVPGWTCTTDGCTPICGDGVVGDGCSKRDTDCDMTGYWAARETNYTRDTVVQQVQVSSQWSLLRLQQTGTAFTVVENLDCGTHVTGTATGDSTPGLLRGLIHLNRQDDPSGPHGARHGTSQPAAGGCTVSLDRWYFIRGAVDSLLPPDFAMHPALPTLAPLPVEKDPIKGTDTPVGSTDPDGDGIPGAAFAITGIANGTRNEAQRDWKEYATPAGATVPAAALTVVFPGSYDFQGSVLRVTDCGNLCGLLTAGANAAQDVPSRITLAFIGKTPGSPRVAQVVAGPPRQNIDDDLTTCARVRLTLPHDPSLPP